MDKKTIRILSVDGGGVKGLAVIHFLKKIEEKYNKNIYDMFDVFAGCSIGAIIVSIIAYNKISVREFIEKIYTKDFFKDILNKSLFDRLFKSVQFSPKYDGTHKSKKIEELFGSSRFINDTEKSVIISSYNFTTKKPRFFKSWDKEDKTTIMDALGISTAAPSYYPSVYNKFDDSWNIDGGVCANNPSLACYSDIIDMYGPENDVQILSIGTGKIINNFTGDQNDVQNWGGIQWVTKGGLLDIIMNGASDTTNYYIKNMTKALGHKYVRINGYLKCIELDNCSDENLKDLEIAGNDWFDSNESVLEDFFEKSI